MEEQVKLRYAETTSSAYPTQAEAGFRKDHRTTDRRRQPMTMISHRRPWGLSFPTASAMSSAITDISRREQAGIRQSSSVTICCGIGRAVSAGPCDAPPL